MAISHPFLRTKKNMHHQCCTNIFTVPGTVEGFHLIHATVLQKTEITGFLNPSFSSAWDVGKRPGNLPTCCWAPLLIFNIFHWRRRGYKLSANQAAGPHICIWALSLSLLPHSQPKYRKAFAPFIWHHICTHIQWYTAEITTSNTA